LVELLMTIFILLVAIGISVASFSNTKQIDQVEAAARRIASILRESQNNSLVGKQQFESGDLVNTCLNGVEWNESYTDRIVLEKFYVASSSGACSTSNRSTNIEKEELEGVVLSGAAADSMVYFTVPSGRVAVSGFTASGGAMAGLKIESIADSSVEAMVCVYSSGRIEEVLGEANCP